MILCNKRDNTIRVFITFETSEVKAWALVGRGFYFDECIDTISRCDTKKQREVLLKSRTIFIVF